MNVTGKKKWNAEELSEFCRQVGAMTEAGITMAKSMEILKNVTESKRRAKVYGELEERIRNGQSIGDSMEAIGVFPEMMVNMFRAAEASGQLEKTANHLAENYRKEHRLTSQLRTAALYPKLLCVMAVSIVMFVFLVIIPMVEPLFENMELPMVTKILMEVSRGMKTHWYLILCLLFLPFALGPYLLSLKPVRRLWDKVLLHVPVTGKLMRTICTARFARCQSSLYFSGVSMVDSLRIASRTLGNKYLESQFTQVIHKVENGTALSTAMATVDGLDKKLSAVMCVGEETGKLDVMLTSLADGYEHEAETAMNRMVSLFEPLLIVVIGVIVAVILLGIMVPMWSMYEYMV